MKIPKIDKRLFFLLLEMDNPSLKKIEKTFKISEAEAQRYLDIYESRQVFLDSVNSTQNAVGSFEKEYLSKGYRFLDIEAKTVNNIMGSLAVEGSYRLMETFLQANEQKDSERMKVIATLLLGFMSYMKTNHNKE